MSRSMFVVLGLISVACADRAVTRMPEQAAAPSAVVAAVPAVPAGPVNPPPMAAEAAVEPAQSYAASPGRSLQWKRNAALEADLMRGLELTRDELCQELGSQSCIRAVHTVALGGNDPFGSGLLKPAAGSLTTTPLAVDRVTLSACSQRARADKQGPAKVFTAFDLAGSAPAASSQAVVDTIRALFQRLLARDPKPVEVQALQGLLEGEGAGMSAEEFATLSCFVVASSLEALFF